MSESWINSVVQPRERAQRWLGGARLEDSLLVSGPSFEERQGGLYFLKRSGWTGGIEITCLDRFSTSGMAAENGLFVRSIQSEEFMILGAYTETSVWTIASEKYGQIHDVRVIDGKLYVVAANSNEVVLMTTAGEVEKSWKFPGGKDSWHLNCVDVWDGRVVACAFGRFEQEGGFRGSRGTGIIFDLETENDIWTGLTAPHTPRVDVRGYKYVCDSGTRRLLIRKDGTEDSVDFRHCFTRGLAFGEKFIYVGLSRLRKKGPDVTTIPCAKIAILDAETFKQTGEVEVPMPEIYDIMIVPN